LIEYQVHKNVAIYGTFHSRGKQTELSHYKPAAGSKLVIIIIIIIIIITP
jgi:hypothetical protein